MWVELYKSKIMVRKHKMKHVRESLNSYSNELINTHNMSTTQYKINTFFAFQLGGTEALMKIRKLVLAVKLVLPHL